MKNFILIAFVLLATMTSLSQAETTKCKAITKVPYMITVSGVYCLTKDLNYASNNSAITINTDNVILDLNGHVLSGEAAGSATGAWGIYVSARHTVTIKNGTVRGFQAGVLVADSLGASKNNVVENINAEANTVWGIWLASTFGIARNNHVTEVGGATPGPNVAAYGIYVIGDYTRVLNNNVSDVAAQGTGHAFGIRSNGGNNIFVSGNNISDVSSSVVAIGIDLWGGTDHIVSDNRISTTDTAGVYFDNLATGSYMNNLVVNATTAYVNGTAAGSTNF